MYAPLNIPISCPYSINDPHPHTLTSVGRGEEAELVCTSEECDGHRRRFRAPALSLEAIDEPTLHNPDEKSDFAEDIQFNLNDCQFFCRVCNHFRFHYFQDAGVFCNNCKSETTKMKVVSVPTSPSEKSD